MPPEIVYSGPCSDPAEAMREARRRQPPRLTIGIPTYNRPEMLRHAVSAALAQTVPVKVLVSDDGDDHDATRRIVDASWPQAEAFGSSVECYHSGAKTIVENWDSVARRCDTEFFMWLQDDDHLFSATAARVASAFDQFPEADTWMAQNKIGPDTRHFWFNNGNGPWVPLPAGGGVDQWECEVLTPTSYFLSWSLSPAVAFRTGPAFTRSLDAMPFDCDIFAERLILVGMGGRFIADPHTAGIWVQHRGNFSRQHHADQPRQTEILIRRLDREMDALGDRWPELFEVWCRMQHPHWITGWMGDLDHAEKEGGKSRHGRAIRDVMIGSLHGRVRFVPRYRWWRRAFNAIQRRAACLLPL